MSNNNNDNNDIKGFDYDTLVEESLKDVVKKVLQITSDTGLIGDSHFFISFNGNDPDVKVPTELKSLNDADIKIIIQHQFWNLKTTDDHFEVTLSFNGQRKNIFVPFKAITSFTDPSVGFGLQFKTEVKKSELESINLNFESIDDKKNIKALESNHNKSGEIVSLDEFRDKK